MWAVCAPVGSGSARRTGGKRPCRAMQSLRAGRVAAVHLLGMRTRMLRWSIRQGCSGALMLCRAGLGRPGNDMRGGVRARLLDEEVAQVDAGQAALRGRDGVEDGRVRRARIAPLPAWARAKAQPSSGHSVLC